jgi:DNA-binding CsgD family transcriptional regulator
VVDQLGLHRAWNEPPFTAADHKLVRLFHVELGRLWKRDAIRRAKDPASALPPRLTQTLNELLAGSSEKQIALKLELSRHTIHNYVKALHQRFGVSSRGELLARVGKEKASFTPKLSMELPREKDRETEKERQPLERD